MTRKARRRVVPSIINEIKRLTWAIYASLFYRDEAWLFWNKKAYYSVMTGIEQSRIAYRKTGGVRYDKH